MNWLILAQTGEPARPTGVGGGAWMLIVPILFMFVIFYFLLIRPQKKQEKARKEMLKDLQKNDKVVTIGGIHGVVANVRRDDKMVTLKIDESGNVRIRVSRNAISRIMSKDADEKDED